METTERGTNAYKTAYEKIKEMLFNMEIRPGDSIAEIALTKKLGMSRTPIREAMRTLEREGIIYTENGRKKVPRFSLEDLQQIFELKTVIECEAIALATNRQTVQQKKQMLKIRKDISCIYEKIISKTITEQEAYEEWDNLDRKFHELLFEMSCNQRAKEIVDNLNLQWHRYRIGLESRENRMLMAIQEHIEMANLVINNKPLEAKEKMEAHMKNLYDELLNYTETFL